MEDTIQLSQLEKEDQNFCFGHGLDARRFIRDNFGGNYALYVSFCGDRRRARELVPRLGLAELEPLPVFFTEAQLQGTKLFQLDEAALTQPIMSNQKTRVAGILDTAKLVERMKQE